MKKQTIAILMGIFLISLASTMYAGDTYYRDLTEEIQNLHNFTCEIIDNSSNLEGLNFSVNSTGYIISTELNYKPDKFNVTCILDGWKQVPYPEPQIVYRSSGGGGSTKYVDRNVTQNITTYLDRPITTYLTNETVCGVKIICEDIPQDEKDFWNKKGWERFWNWVSNLFVTNK